MIITNIRLASVSFFSDYQGCEIALQPFLNCVMFPFLIPQLWFASGIKNWDMMF